jgi:hypothetical protein
MEGGFTLKVYRNALLLFYLSVSELFLPTTWMFLGIAHWHWTKSALTCAGDRNWRRQLTLSPY